MSTETGSGSLNRTQTETSFKPSDRNEKKDNTKDYPRFNSAAAMTAYGGQDSVPASYGHYDKFEETSVLPKDDVNKIRSENVHNSIQGFTMFKEDPVHLAYGRGQYLFDVDGKKYLDGFGGICTVGVGHCHPYVTDALHKQADQLWHNSALYIHSKMHEFAEKLVKKLNKPDKLTKVYFVNSGSEANDLAMQMARVYTQRDQVVGLRNGYHGMGGGTGNLTSHSTWRHFNGGAVVHAMCPDPLHGPFGGKRNGKVVRTDKPELDHENAHLKYAEQLEQAILYGTNGQIAAFFAEPIQGVGGTVQLCDGYLKEAYKVARKYGGVCVCDEVQTGFGRLGESKGFWGFEMAGVDPDIVVMAKSIGNGFPLAAVVTTEDIAAAFAKKLHFNTYGGNPLSSAVGKAVLEVIEMEELPKNCDKIGGLLIDGFEALQKKYEYKENKAKIIGDVRGLGLMLGVEFWNEDGSPATQRCMGVVESMKEQGVLVGKGGLHGNALRIKPPMCWTAEDASMCLNAVEEGIRQVFAKEL